MGSKFARLACGTKRKVRAAAPWERAGIEKPPAAARLPAPANPFNRVLRCIGLSQSRVVMAVPPISLAEGSAPHEVKRAGQTDSDPPLLRANGMPPRPYPASCLNFDDSLGCHQRPPITTPSDTILRSPIRCSPTTSWPRNWPFFLEMIGACPTLPGLK